MVWRPGALLSSLQQAARRSGFALRTHEQLRLSPIDEFRLSRELGLEWTYRAEGYLENLSRSGQG